MLNVFIGFALGWSAARIISGQPIIPPGLGQKVEQVVNQAGQQVPQYQPYQ